MKSLVTVLTVLLSLWTKCCNPKKIDSDFDWNTYFEGLKIYKEFVRTRVVTIHYFRINSRYLFPKYFDNKIFKKIYLFQIIYAANT